MTILWKSSGNTFVQLNEKFYKLKNHFVFQEELGAQVSMNCQMTCVCSGRGFIFVGDDAGRVHFLNRRMEIKTLKLFEGDVEQLLQVNSCTNIPKIRTVEQKSQNSFN